MLSLFLKGCHTGHCIWDTDRCRRWRWRRGRALPGSWQESSRCSCRGVSLCCANDCKAAQVALAARPGSAWFLAAEEREWLQRRQDREQARRQAELAASGKAWGALLASRL